ncbi:hypothetical protein BTHI11S_01556 [Bosea thiooxidans]
MKSRGWHRPTGAALGPGSRHRDDADLAFLDRLGEPAPPRLVEMGAQRIDIFERIGADAAVETVCEDDAQRFGLRQRGEPGLAGGGRVQDGAGAHRRLVAQPGGGALRARDPDELTALDDGEPAIFPRRSRQPVEHDLARVRQATAVEIPEGELRELQGQAVGARMRVLRDEATLGQCRQQPVRRAEGQFEPLGEQAEIDAVRLAGQRLHQFQRPLDRCDRQPFRPSFYFWK